MSVIPKFVLSMCLFIICESFKNGAPPKACNDMTPGHLPYTTQTSASPFVIDISPLDDTLNSISVSISHPNSDEFRGFLIQARLHTDKTKILDGTFSTNKLAKQSTCQDGVGTYLTHSSSESKNIVQTTWTPPAGFEGQVIFRATVVKEFRTFWVGIESKPIFVKGTDDVPTTVDSNQTQMGIYNECGKNKGCFGLPDGCLSKSDCTLILSYIPEKEDISFQLIGAIRNNGWIAVGFSFDQKMGDDSVTECIYDKEDYTLQQSWNVAVPKRNNERITNPQGSIIEKLQQSYENGVLTCGWKQNYNTSVKQHTFDLRNYKYYLLLAIGSMNDKGVKQMHSDQLASATEVNLTEISTIQGKPSLLIKIHGSFMVAAWLSFISIGILLARYYKQVWEGSTLCKTKIWFAFHRAIMLLAVALIIAAFVAIFLHEDGWSEAYPHSILGCITTGLALIQVIAGLARPNPNSSKRPAFNWLHWLNGNCSQILAIITIFFAIQLKQANLPKYCFWILIGYIAFHLIFHLTMQFHNCCMEKKDTNEIKLHQLGQKRETEVVRDSPGGGFRRFMLGIYVVVSSGIVAALVLIICLN